MTAARELVEELGVAGASTIPIFLTVTGTVGVDAGHTDVSLWFPARRTSYSRPHIQETVRSVLGRSIGSRCRLASSVRRTRVAVSRDDR